MNSIGGIGASSVIASAASIAAGVRQRRQPVAERAVADLVVVLQEVDEGGRRQVRRSARRAAAPSRCGDGSP